MPTIAQLRQAVIIAEQIEKLQAELAGLIGGTASSPSAPSTVKSSQSKRSGKRKMSAAGRASIVAAQKARWAKKKGEEVVSAVEVAVEKAVKSTGKFAKNAKRKLSPEGRAKIVAALKKRWAAKKKGAK